MIWCTEFKALCALTGELKTWCGENVEAPSKQLAQEWCYKNRGHLTVTGQLLSEIPCLPNSYAADWENKIDYEAMQLN